MVHSIPKGGRRHYGPGLHRGATTTAAIRRAIQHSQESLRVLARRHGINPKTVAKWRKRCSVADLPTGPRAPRSTVLSLEEEAVVVAFRQHTLLPLDDCLYALQATIPKLTRSSLHRCLERHGISRLPEVEGSKPDRKKFDRYPIGYFHIDLAEVRTAEGKLYLFVAVDRTSKFTFVELVEHADMRAAAAFLEALVAAVPYRIHTILTDNGIQFADLPRNRRGPTAHFRGPSLRPRLSSLWNRTSPDKTQSSLDQRPSRAHEPNHQGSHCSAVPLRQPQTATNPSLRLRCRIQLRPAAQDSRWSHRLRVHL
jgi:transposase-like protein